MTSPALTLIREKLDRVGVLISALCLVHCVSGLALIAFLGVGAGSFAIGAGTLGATWGGALLDPRVHQVGLALAMAIGALGLGFGALRHGRFGPVMLGGLGLVLMAVGLAVPHGFAEAAATVPGVALLAFAHIRNLRHPA